jgi:hypothetical protein
MLRFTPLSLTPSSETFTKTGGIGKAFEAKKGYACAF